MAIAALSGCSASKQMQAQKVVPAQPAPTAGPNETVVKLSPCNLKRQVGMKIEINALGIPEIKHPKPEPLVKGEVTVGPEHVVFYLPARGPYSNQSKDNHSFNNTSTCITVDANNDGDLNRGEDWYSSLPVRLGDQMFAVKEFDPGSTWVYLARSRAPLSGMVVGKPCPPFAFETQDGQHVTNATYKGKALLLDVWSMT